MNFGNVFHLVSNSVTASSKTFMAFLNSARDISKMPALSAEGFLAISTKATPRSSNTLPNFSRAEPTSLWLEFWFRNSSYFVPAASRAFSRSCISRIAARVGHDGLALLVGDQGFGFGRNGGVVAQRVEILFGRVVPAAAAQAFQESLHGFLGRHRPQRPGGVQRQERRQKSPKSHEFPTSLSYRLKMLCGPYGVWPNDLKPLIMRPKPLISGGADPQPSIPRLPIPRLPAATGDTCRPHGPQSGEPTCSPASAHRNGLTQAKADSAVTKVQGLMRRLYRGVFRQCSRGGRTAARPETRWRQTGLQRRTEPIGRQRRK